MEELQGLGVFNVGISCIAFSRPSLSSWDTPSILIGTGSELRCAQVTGVVGAVLGRGGELQRARRQVQRPLWVIPPSTCSVVQALVYSCVSPPAHGPLEGRHGVCFVGGE